MSPVAKPESPLRAALEAAALRFADEIADAIERASTLPEWVDQSRSPLGKRRHLELVRKGAFPDARKDGKRVLVRRADLERYLDEHRRLPTGHETGEACADERAAELLGLRAVKGGR